MTVPPARLGDGVVDEVVDGALDLEAVEAAERHGLEVAERG